ncbi:MAG TPA: metallophosphoesterase [Candidatus Deferrimicrobium sp.]|nr:metallophosphoesterase [Candidatus Deferrimicrobium sp.]
MTHFRLLHISDLHFSNGVDGANLNHAHSIRHLKGLGNMISRFPDIDRLLISGDISDSGDRESLITASNWLFRNFGIGDDEEIGLNLHPEKIGMVPGNHDAWNASSTGSLFERRQKSLKNYNDIFVKHSFPDNDGCRYEWLEKDGAGIYIAYVDSSLLGEHATVPFFQDIAKGKLSPIQAEKLLEWYDRGLKGFLKKPNYVDEYINADAFSRSLKIIMMHHYLFEPPGKGNDYCLNFFDRDTVFKNIALADFDILLCGHKHYPAFDTHTYGAHFDDCDFYRYLFNYFRRVIGIFSLPIQYKNKNGKYFSKAMSQFLNIFIKFKKKGNPNPPRPYEIIQILKRGLDAPDLLVTEVGEYLNEHDFDNTGDNDPQELLDIKKALSDVFSKEERKKIQIIAERVLINIARSFKTRPFLQVMSGSSAKAPTQPNSNRSFNFYNISYEEKIWTFASDRYVWDSGSNEFLDNPLSQQQQFRKYLT